MVIDLLQLFFLLFFFFLFCLYHVCYMLYMSVLKTMYYVHVWNKICSVLFCSVIIMKSSVILSNEVLIWWRDFNVTVTMTQPVACYVKENTQLMFCLKKIRPHEAANTLYDTFEIDRTRLLVYISAGRNGTVKPRAIA